METIESAGEFAVRGGIIDIFPPGGDPARIDLFGDEVEGLFAIDLDSMASRSTPRRDLDRQRDGRSGADRSWRGIVPGLRADLRRRRAGRVCWS